MRNPYNKEREVKMNTEQNNDIQQLAAALRQKREGKCFEVRFQEIRTHRVFVEANNASEADFMAIREFQGSQADTSLIRTEFDFFTICPIEQAQH
jgi:hypothetical protein